MWIDGCSGNSSLTRNQIYQLVNQPQYILWLIYQLLGILTGLKTKANIIASLNKTLPQAHREGEAGLVTDTVRNIGEQLWALSLTKKIMEDVSAHQKQS